MSLAPGTRLGPYEIVRPLGAGGMGEVYCAQDTRLERTVAIKILSAQFSADPLRKQRFEREAKTISSLNHPHICVLYDIGQKEGIDYLVMECVEGEMLSRRLEKGPLPLEQALKYAAQIADALEKAHRKGIVHRDLKPGNIMLTPCGAKLLDFGLAKPAVPLAGAATLTITGQPPMTEEGTVVGTFQYMSPEQIEGQDVDGRSDIFSFGAVLYEMVTGKRAFEGKSRLSVASAILEKEPAPISSLRPIAPALDHVVQRCLAKNPDERWQTAADLKCELQWIASRGAGEFGSPSRARSRRSLFIYTASVAVVALAFAGVIWRQATKVRPTSQPIRLTVTLPPSNPIAVINGATALAFSPDNRRMAYVVQDGDTTRLMLRDLGAFDGKLLPETEGATAPFFSPDGQWVGFYAEGKLKKISITGGPAIILSSAPEGNGATWLPDDTIVFSADWREGLRRVSASGGTTSVVTRPDPQRGEAFHWWPESLSDGQAVLFTDQSGPGSEDAGIAVLSLRSGKWRIVVKNGSSPRYIPQTKTLIYLRGDELWAAPFDPKSLEVTGPSAPVLAGFLVNRNFSAAQIAVSRGGAIAYVPGMMAQVQNTLMKVDRSGHEEALSDIRQPYEDLTLSPNGRFLALTIMGDTWNVWLYDLERGTLSRVTFDGDNRDPIWTADSKRVVYVSSRNGRFGMYWKPISGSAPEEELTTTDSLPWPTSCSTNGKWCAYDVGPPPQGAGIYLLPLSGEHKPAQAVSEPSAQDLTISPDGNWAAYQSAESGRNEIYIRQFPFGTTKWQVSTEGGVRPLWAPSGRELFFRNEGVRTKGNVMSVSVETAPSISIGRPKQLFAFRYEQAGHDYAVLPDGQHFICIKESDSSAREVKVVLNWASELATK